MSPQFSEVGVAFPPSVVPNLTSILVPQGKIVVSQHTFERLQPHVRTQANFLQPVSRDTTNSKPEIRDLGFIFHQKFS